MPTILASLKYYAAVVGRTPWSAAAPPVGLSGDSMGLIWMSEERVQGDPRGPGGPPYYYRVNGRAATQIPHSR
jgi:hypothetical protein